MNNMSYHIFYVFRLLHSLSLLLLLFKLISRLCFAQATADVVVVVAVADHNINFSNDWMLDLLHATTVGVVEDEKEYADALSYTFATNPPSSAH